MQARGEPAADPAPDLPLSADVDRALSDARALSFDLTGERLISTEATFLAVLQADPALATALAGFGLDLTRLEGLYQQGQMPPVTLESPLELADLTERIDIARILDASFNRAREALRVIEDYCRFGLDDAFLSSQLKTLRHDLTAAIEEHAPPELLVARETQADVGTALSTDSERERGSLAEVVQANLKRLQEALRSLEEFAKVTRPLLAERVESMRYRAYTLERALLLGRSARTVLQDARLYVLLSRRTCAAALDWTIAEAAAGGAAVVQLREKTLPDSELVALARAVRGWTRRAGVLFLVNDRPDIARLAEADGVHLGQDDLSVKDARRILGPDALIGVSTHSVEQMRQAVLDGASYVGVGPVFASRTKTFDGFAGLEFVRAAAAETTLPAFAIGGITPDNVSEVVEAGLRRVAVSSTIAEADDPQRVARQLVAALE
ncbi:MAG: thiamine phosphate synthase [Gemmataceae bacterium]